MPDTDLPLELLVAVRDVGITHPELEPLCARVQSAVDREIADETDRPRVRRRSVGRARRRPSVGAVVASLSTIVSVAVAVAAIALLSQHRGAQQPASAGAGQLIAKLAVLRRPQTPADRLPTGHQRVQAVHHEGTIIPSLTRLVATRGEARLFLVVRTPAGGPLPTWSPKLGDQVSVIEVSAGRASETEPIPAADLTNADEVMHLGNRGSTSNTYDLAIVPDGVARVRWTFANQAFKPGRTITAPAIDNLAIVPLEPDTESLLLHGSWYAADGRVIPTSGQAVLRANAARQAVQSARIIRYDAHHSYRAAPTILAAFAVFAVTSRTGVRTASGDIISHPPLSAVPYSILQGAATPDTPPQLDPYQIREVITRSGLRVYVIPGRRGLCLATLDRSRFPDGILTGGASSSSANIAQAISQGVGFSSRHLGGPTITYRIVPRSIKTITIRSKHGTRKRIAVPDGIYVHQSG